MVTSAMCAIHKTSGDQLKYIPEKPIEVIEYNESKEELTIFHDPDHEKDLEVTVPVSVNPY